MIHAIENLKIGDSSDFQTSPEPKTIEPLPTKKAREDLPCPKCGLFKGRKFLINCVQCNRNYHIRCVRANKAQAEALNFVCSPCRGVTVTVPEPTISPTQTIPSTQTTTDSQATPDTSTPDFSLLQHLQNRKASVSILGNIPRGARITAADTLNQLITEALESNSSLAWAKLHCVASHGLKKTKREKSTPNSPSLATKIKSQLTDFSNSKFPPDDLSCPPRKANPKPKSSDELLAKRVDARFAEMDIRGAIRELSSDEKIADDTLDTLTQLKSKHPEAPIGTSLPPAPENADSHTPISSEAVRKAIISFPAGSAGGPDGLKPVHLKNLIGASEAGNRLLLSVTKLCNFVLSDKIHEEIRPIFFGANLFAFSKKDRGIRPIAVGNTLRRLATKVGLKPVTQELGNFLRPNQLGYGTKGGSEAAAHAIRHYISKNTKNKVFLKLDISNAFNSMRRDHILHKVKETQPSLYNLFWQANSKPSHLFYRDKLLSSESGLQQGDPGGPALFSLGLDQIVKELRSKLNL